MLIYYGVLHDHVKHHSHSLLISHSQCSASPVAFNLYDAKLMS